MDRRRPSGQLDRRLSCLSRCERKVPGLGAGPGNHLCLGWAPRYNLKDLVMDMMKSDMALFKRDRYLVEGGHKVMEHHE